MLLYMYKCKNDNFSHIVILAHCLLYSSRHGEDKNHSLTDMTTSEKLEKNYSMLYSVRILFQDLQRSDLQLVAFVVTTV